MHNLILHNSWALGDTVCLSALGRDIQLAYPGEYNVYMSGHYKNVFWHNNPYCKAAPERPDGQLIKLEYLTGIRQCNNGLKKHFLGWFHKSLEDSTGLKVPVTEPKGVICLSKDELRQRPEGRYWVIVAGGKLDMTAKVWATAYWQQTVDTLKKHGIRCVQAGGDFNRHFHPKLNNVEQYVGKTQNERNFFSLIAGSDGVICGITAAMHIAAVFDKPCVVIAGGREAPWWEAYTNDYEGAFGPKCAKVKVEHTFLHTVGLLDCGVGNLDRGCWKDRAFPLDQADFSSPRNKEKLCRKPTNVGEQKVPECLKRITPDHVIEAVMRYHEKGILLPIGTVTKKFSLPVVELNTSTQVGWDKNWDKQLPALAQPKSSNEPAGFTVLDHPYVGGKFTVFVLGFGDNLDILERCLNSIFDTCPPDRVDIRVAVNQPSARVRSYVVGLMHGGLVSKVYEDRGSRRKYPAMREMFWDKSHPISTPYVVWFDDDSWCRKSDWLIQLANTIIANHPQQGRLFGAKYTHDLMTVKRKGALREAWFKSASWWKGKPLYLSGGTRTGPNGSQIVFASGGFWALATHVIREQDIPDVRLNHNGGDITIGCQVTQAGYKVIDFSPRPAKAIIAWSDSPRRGFHEEFPWS